MKLFVIFYFFLFSLFQISVFAQNKSINNLKFAIKKADSDTAKARLYVALSDEIYYFNLDTVIPLCESALKIIDKKMNRAGIEEKKSFLVTKGNALNNIGYVYQTKGNIPDAIRYLLMSFQIMKVMDNKIGMANSLINIGFIYDNQYDVYRALEYYHKGLKIQEEINDKKGIATTLNNIGYTYNSINENAKALNYHSKSMKIREEIKDMHGIAECLNNLAFEYGRQDKFKESIECFIKSLEIREQLKDQRGKATILNNLGYAYRNKGDIVKGLEYYNKGLEISQKLNYTDLEAMILNNIANAISTQGQKEMAIKYSEKSLELAKKLRSPAHTRDASELLSILYYKTGNYKTAYEMSVLFKKLEDSLQNSTNRKAAIQKAFQYDYDKKTAKDSIKSFEEKKLTEAKLMAGEAKLKEEKTKRFALYGGLTLLIVFAGFMFNRFKVTQKQKNIIELKEQETQKQNEIITEQKKVVEEKQKEILDSIHYAKRIQTALITSEKYIDRNLNRLNKG